MITVCMVKGEPGQSGPPGPAGQKGSKGIGGENKIKLIRFPRLLRTAFSYPSSDEFMSSRHRDENKEKM